jgi:hypothetical protein
MALSPSPGIAALKDRLAAVKLDMHRTTLGIPPGQRSPHSHGSHAAPTSLTTTLYAERNDSAPSVRHISPPRSNVAKMSRLFDSSAPRADSLTSYMRPSNEADINRVASAPKVDTLSSDLSHHDRTPLPTDPIHRLLVNAATSPHQQANGSSDVQVSKYNLPNADLQQLQERVKDSDKVREEAVTAIVQMEGLVSDAKLELQRVQEELKTEKQRNVELAAQVHLVSLEEKKWRDECQSLTCQLADAEAVYKAQRGLLERELAKTKEELSSTTRRFTELENEIRSLKTQLVAEQEKNQVPSKAVQDRPAPSQATAAAGASPAGSPNNQRSVHSEQVEQQPVRSEPITAPTLNDVEGDRITRLEIALERVMESNFKEEQNRGRMSQEMASMQKCLQDLSSIVGKLVTQTPIQSPERQQGYGLQRQPQGQGDEWASATAYSYRSRSATVFPSGTGAMSGAPTTPYGSRGVMMSPVPTRLA